MKPKVQQGKLLRGLLEGQPLPCAGALIDTDKKAIAGLIPDGVNRDGAFGGTAGDHGRSHDREVLMWGFNSRLDNLQAAYLDFQFKDYQRVIDRRRALARLYQQ